MMNEEIFEEKNREKKSSSQASTSVPDLTYYPDKLTKYPQFLEKKIKKMLDVK